MREITMPGGLDSLLRQAVETALRHAASQTGDLATFAVRALASKALVVDVRIGVDLDGDGAPDGPTAGAAGSLGVDDRGRVLVRLTRLHLGPVDTAPG